MNHAIENMLYKMSSAKWLMAVIFICSFCWCMIHGINLPDYAVVIGTIIVKAYFDEDHKTPIYPKKEEPQA